MDLTEKQLLEMEQLAGAFLNIKEIATVMQLEEAELTSDFENPASTIHQIIQRGRLKSKAELHQVVLKMAMGGSAPAQNLVLKFMQKAEIDEL